MRITLSFVKVSHRILNGLLPRSESRAVYTFTMACYSITITVLATRLASVLGLWTEVSSDVLANAQQLRASPWWNQVVVDLLLAPVSESLALIGIIELLRFLKRSATAGVIVATLFFSALHSFTIPVWGIICIPAFFIDSVSYVYWRRISFWAGLQTAVVLHICGNLPPVLYSLTHGIGIVAFQHCP